MPDVFSEEKRSEIMSANRGKGNKSTELRLQSLLEEAGIEGWRIHASDLPGKPDFVFDDKKIAIFADGCFWHACPTCRNIPETNKEFWTKKIGRTVERDREINQLLSEAGWGVIRFWEHELKKHPESCMETLLNNLNN